MYNNILPVEQAQKRKVFVSFHHDDQAYRTAFDQMYGEDFISMSVDYGDIEPQNTDEHIKRLVQEDHIVNSSVVFALYGANTHQRKHVDWEISAALTDKVGGHKGFVVMILPTFPVRPFNTFGGFDQSLIYPYVHPRTAANLKSGYADLYFWPGMYPSLPGVKMADIIESAFNKRDTHDHLIDNSHPQYQRNLG